MTNGDIGFRQGDVVIRAVKSIPKSAKKLDHMTFAEGEVTGHAHRVTEGKGTLYSGDDGVLYFHVDSDTSLLTHEEHDEVVMPKNLFPGHDGDYEIRIKRQYIPQGWERVHD